MKGGRLLGGGSISKAQNRCLCGLVIIKIEIEYWAGPGLGMSEGER